MGNVSSLGWKVRGCNRLSVCFASRIHPGPSHASRLHQPPLHLTPAPSQASLASLPGGWRRPWWGPPGPAPCAGAPSPCVRELTVAGTVLCGIPSLRPCSSPRLHGRKLRLAEGARSLPRPSSYPHPIQLLAYLPGGARVIPFPQFEVAPRTHCCPQGACCSRRPLSLQARSTCASPAS